MIIKSENLMKIYTQGGKSIYAVNNCNISINKGEFVAVTGVSGSGKSTLLHLLAIFDVPTSGKIYIDEEDISIMSDNKLSKIRNEKIGFIFQNFQLLPILTAKENIIMPSLIKGQKVSETYLKELTELLGIDDRLDHLPGELSGGQQQRVAIARALINRPQIVFADEPTGNLDKESASDIVKLLLKMQEQYNQTLVVVTHDINIAQRADIIYNIIDGVVSKQ